MPYAFNVATKVLRMQISSKIKGYVVMYVGDVIGFCAEGDLVSDMSIAKCVIECMFWPNTVAEDKTDSGTNLDVIGWNLDCRNKTFSLSERNADRALWRFLQLDEEGLVAISDLDTIASLASRYALVCREMKPYVGHLYAVFAGMSRGRFGGNKKTKVVLSEEAKHSIRRWRAFLCLQELDRDRARRPMMDLVIRMASHLIEFDASLTGIGLRIFEVDSEGEEVLIIVSGFETGFQLEGQARYQNTMEFTAVVMGIGFLVKEGITGAGLRLRGDSTTSLVWSTEESFKAGPSENAAAAFLVLGQVSQNFVESGDHLKGIWNTKCDRLSRGESPMGVS